MGQIFTWLDKNQPVGLLLLRLFIGVRLIYGVADNILSWQKMHEFRDFLHAFHFPFPLAAAMLSVYAQALGGLSYITGWKVRYAAMLMIVNFSLALIMVHRNQGFEEMTSALAMLFISILLLFTGNKILPHKIL
jgi:putative oxidoreductase